MGDGSRFEALAAIPDADIDVALGAALIARDVYGSLDVDAVLARFDELARPLAGRGLGGAPARVQAEQLSQHIYDACGFSGNETDYYDPRNSLISDVLDRRLGIPITLAIVYGEVARRVGVRARGVAFPGHFLVRLEGDAGLDAGGRDDLRPDGEAGAPLLVDPFFGGRVLDDDALTTLYTRVSGRTAPPPPALLEPASPRAMLVRMLVNLRSIYLSRGDLARAMLAIDRIVCLTPDAPEPLRERGLLSARLGASASAIADLERFLVLAPGAEDADAIRVRLQQLRVKPAAPN